MGVRRSDYVIVGANIGYDKANFEDEDFELLYEERRKPQENDILYLLDGMSGEYFIVGIPLVWTDDYDGLGYHEFEINKYDQDLDRVKDKVNDYIEVLFGVKADSKLIVMTHWH